MFTTVTETMFKDEFHAMGRGDNFSYEGLSALYDFFIEMEEETGEPMELDVIAICCEFTEEPIADVLENYGYKGIDELFDNTVVVAHFGDTVLYQAH